MWRQFYKQKVKELFVVILTAIKELASKVIDATLGRLTG